MESLIFERGGRRAVILWNLFNLGIEAILLGALVYAWDKIDFRPRRFKLDDPYIAQPMHHDTVPYWLVVFLGLLVPILTFLAYALYEARKMNKFLSNFIVAYHWTYGLLTSLVTTIILTELIKVLAQKFRPDFLERCFPDYPNQNLFTTRVNVGYIASTTECTNQDQAVLNDGRKSFLSGHSSSVFCTAVYFSLFFYRYHFRSIGKVASFMRAQEMRRMIQELVYKKKYEQKPIKPLYDDQTTPSQAWKFIFMFAPLLWAIFVGTSRLFDNRHHLIDVILGGLLGMAISLAVYWCMSWHYFPWDHLSLYDKSKNQRELLIKSSDPTSNSALNSNNNGEINNGIKHNGETDSPGQSHTITIPNEIQ